MMYFVLSCFIFYVLCLCDLFAYFVFFFKQKTAYEMRISDWSSDVCSSDLDVLTAGARRAIGVDLEVAFVDLDLDIVVDHRIDPDAREAGVAPRRAVVGRDADEAVNAAFGLGIAIGIFALHQHRRRFDARLFARLIFDELDLHPPLFGPPPIHALAHLIPET